MSEASEDEAPKPEREPEREPEGRDPEDREMTFAPDDGDPNDPLGAFDAAALPAEDYIRLATHWATDNDVPVIEFNDDNASFRVTREGVPAMRSYQRWLRRSRIKALAITSVAWQRAKVPAPPEETAAPDDARTDRMATLFAHLTLAFAAVGLAHLIVIAVSFLRHSLG